MGLGTLAAFIPLSSATAPQGKQVFRDEKQQRFNARQGRFQTFNVTFLTFFHRV
jgi:hypothetical protein